MSAFTSKVFPTVLLFTVLSSRSYTCHRCFEAIRNITQDTPSSAQIHCLLLIHRPLFMEIQNMPQRENAKLHQHINTLRENKRTSRQKIEVHEDILSLTNMASTHPPYIRHVLRVNKKQLLVVTYPRPRRDSNERDLSDKIRRPKMKHKQM